MTRTKNLGVILTTIGAALVIPIILGCISNAHAESTDFSITVEPSASITLSSNSVNLEITPTRQGVYRSGSLTVSAATNSPSGYNLVMTTTEPDLVSDTLNAATNAFPHIATIAESENGISAADFEASTDDNILNHWGIAIDSGNFNAMKTSKTIKTTAAAASADVTTISIASKLNLLTVPGKYSTTINFAITANPVPDTLESAYGNANKTKATINGRDYYAMQDMTTAICEDVDVIPSTLKVYDTRDNTIYTIGKLADERCWLLDNLALDLTAPGASTNITSANTNADTTSLNALFGVAVRDASTDPDGNLATAGVAEWTTQTQSSGDYTLPLINTVYKNTTNSSDPIAAIRNSKYGIYYVYCAASAGSYCYSNQNYDRPNTLIDSEYDICPSNWRMPTSSSTGEYENLRSFYSTGESYRTALLAPLQGYLDNDGTVGAQSQGDNGFFWSSTNYEVEDGYTYTLHISAPNNISAYSYQPTMSGFAVRCIAK